MSIDTRPSIPSVRYKDPSIRALINEGLCAEFMASQGMNSTQIEKTVIEVSRKSRASIVGGRVNPLTGKVSLYTHFYEGLYNDKIKGVYEYLYDGGMRPMNFSLSIFLVTKRLPQYLEMAKERGQEERATKFAQKILHRGLEKLTSGSLAHELVHKADIAVRPLKTTLEQAGFVFGAIAPSVGINMQLPIADHDNLTTLSLKTVFMLATTVTNLGVAYYLNPVERRARKIAAEVTNYPHNKRLVTYPNPDTLIG